MLSRCTSDVLLAPVDCAVVQVNSCPYGCSIGSSARLQVARDHEFTVVMAGDRGIGKTALRDRYFHNTFSSTPDPDAQPFAVYYESIMDKRIRVHVYAHAERRYFPISGARRSDHYFRGCDGVLICHDITDPATFNVQQHIQFRERYGPKHVVQMVVGLKSDGEREVDFDEAQELADALGLPFQETSARDNANVENTFRALLARIYNERVMGLSAWEDAWRPSVNWMVEEQTRKRIQTIVMALRFGTHIPNEVALEIVRDTFPVVRVLPCQQICETPMIIVPAQSASTRRTCAIGH